jgi:DNA-binding transcriptional LysR family regulator
MLAEVAHYKTTPTLSIVAIPVIAQYGITTYIAQFKSVHPDIQLTLEEREAAAILPALNSRQFDLAFLRDNYLDTEQYTTLEVARDHFLVALSPQHRLATLTSISLAELADENFILFDKGTIVHELAVEACRRAGFEPRIFYASLRVESVLGMVASNSGVALMMEKVFAYHHPPNILAVPLEPLIESRMVMASLKSTKASRASKKFTHFMEELLKSHP